MGLPKKIKSSKYKGVCKVNAKENPWMMRFSVDGRACVKRYESERTAAIAYDRKMIELGREPVNIFVKQ